MGIVPSSSLGKIQFYESHIANWTSHPTLIGLLPADCVALASLIGAARKAYDDQQLALNAAKSATAEMRLAVRNMHALGAIDISKIKTFAEATNNPNVYPLADLPMPATPGTVPPPGTPTDFTASIEPTGAVTLRWKCPNPPGVGGTQYEIQRKIGGGNYSIISTVGARSFTDMTLPAGSVGVQYQITATRSTLRGVPNVFVVNFGVGGGGGMFIESTSEGTGAMKMAA